MRRSSRTPEKGVLGLSSESFQHWQAPPECATGSKILTEPESDRIGVILTGTSLKKLTGFDRIGRIGRIFTGFKFFFNTKLTSHNINMAGPCYKALAVSIFLNYLESVIVVV